MPEDDFFALSCSCKSCGAGRHNNNEHDENCLSNVPGRMGELLPYWNKGWNNRLACGRTPPDASLSGMSKRQARAYVMGVSCAALMIEWAEARAIAIIRKRYLRPRSNVHTWTAA